MLLRRVALVFALPTLLLGSGCGEGAKVNECNMVVDTVSSGRERLETLVRHALGAEQASAEAPSGLRRTSEVYEELAGALGQLPLNDGELKGAVGDFRATLEGLARRGREAADAWSTGDSKRTADALAHFDHDELSVDERVRSVNHVCQR